MRTRTQLILMPDGVVNGSEDWKALVSELRKPTWHRSTLQRFVDFKVLGMTRNGAGNFYTSTPRVKELLDRYADGDKDPLVWFVFPDSTGGPPVDWPELEQEEPAEPDEEEQPEADAEAPDPGGEFFSDLVVQVLNSIKKRQGKLEERFVQQQRTLDGIQVTLRSFGGGFSDAIVRKLDALALLVATEMPSQASLGTIAGRLNELFDGIKEAATELREAAELSRSTGLQAAALRLRTATDEMVALRDLVLDEMKERPPPLRRAETEAAAQAGNKRQVPPVPEHGWESWPTRKQVGKRFAWSDRTCRRREDEGILTAHVDRFGAVRYSPAEVACIAEVLRENGEHVDDELDALVAPEPKNANALIERMRVALRGLHETGTAS